MATEIVTGIATDVAKDMAGTILGAVIRQIKDVVDLEENIQVLHTDFAHMASFLDYIQNRFQDQHRMLPKPAEMCLKKMDDALTQAKQLIHRVNQQRTRCFGCCILCNPNLSRECREWKTTFDHLFQQLQRDLQILADTEQIVATAAPEAKPLLLQPVPDAGFVGSDIESAEMKLQTWLAEPPHRVVGVWGMGGIGKTSLLRVIHNHFQKVSIFEIVIWVTVSQNLNIGNLQNSSAKALEIAKDLKSFESFDNDSRRMTLSASLEKKKFLLILDDVWEQIYFDEVGISFGNVDKGSKVLISTRSYEVIAAMGAKDSCWEMKLLSEEKAWEMFKSKAFTDGPAALDTNIEAIAREIAKKCQGLPLAVKAVGAAMISKETEEDWSRALTVMGTTADQDFQVNINKRLRYSYDVLLPEELKICFLYCAAFPEDAEIDADRLVEIWIAEGLLRGGQTTQLMDVGRDYLDRLAKRCLIDYYGVPSERYDHLGQRRIKVHDVLREMAIRIGKSEEHCLFATNRHLTDFPGEIEVSSCKRISLGHNDIQDLPTDPMKCPNLLSLLLPFNQKLSHVPEQFLRSVTSLRVLDLSWTGITGLPESVGELRLLEFLDLSRCSKLIKLPESIGNLSALQFFNLDGCMRLKGLPSTIRGLKKLKHLNLELCYGIEVNSDDIGQLVSLNRLVLGNTALRAGDLINLTKMQVLKASVTADGGDVVTIDTWTEIKHLTLSFESNGVNIEKIERVEMVQLNSYGGVTLPNCEFQNLKVLKLSSCTELRELPLRSFPMLTVLKLEWLLELESLTGPSNVWNEGSMSKLQELIIVCCPLLKLPLGMRLPNLKVLHIWMCGMCGSIKELDIGNGDFPMLERLNLKELKELESMDIGNGDFPMLERLNLKELKELESITGSSGVWNEGSMSKLQELDIHDCPLLKKLPLGMRLPNLKLLSIERCDSIKELDIGNGDFPMLEQLYLCGLKELESITRSSGVWNEEATSKLERVQISGCPLLKKLPFGMRLPNLKVFTIWACDSIKELDIGNGDFPMLKELYLKELKELESITGSSGVWNEEATTKLERVEISGCPLLRGGDYLEQWKSYSG